MLLGYITLPVYLAEYCIEEKFHIARDLPVDCILGQEFLVQNNVMCDFKYHRLHFTIKAALRVPEDMVLPANTHSRISLELPYHFPSGIAGLTLRDQVAPHSLLIGSGLVQTGLYRSSSVVPAMVINPNKFDIRLKK